MTPRIRIALLMIGCFALLATGQWLQSQVLINHDVGWILHSAGWLLEGRRFGSDIVDPNPPLIWFLSLPAAAFARLGWLPEVDAMRLYSWVLCAFSLTMSYRVLAPMRGDGKELEAAAIVLAAAFALAILPAAAFAQREFFSFALGLPYVLLVARRLQQAGPRPEANASSDAMVVGIAAGIAFGFKPWMLAVPLLLELAHLVSSRTWRSLFRPETVAMGGVLALYLVSVLVLTPDYLRLAVPLVKSVYWAYDRADAATLASTLRDAWTPIAIAAAALLLARRWSHQATALLCAAAGFSFNFWIQRKGFGYHLYPVVAISAPMLALAVVGASRSMLAARGRVRTSLRFGGVALIVYFGFQQFDDLVWPTRSWLQRFDVNAGVVGQPRLQLIERINALSAGSDTSIYALSTHPFPAFPTLNYVRGSWSSAFPCQFMIPAIAKRANATDPFTEAELDRAIRTQRDVVVREFIERRPDIVMLDSAPQRLGLGFRRFDDLAFYRSDPRFEALWADFREVEGVAQIRLFVRVPPAPASQPLARSRP